RVDFSVPVRLYWTMSSPLPVSMTMRLIGPVEENGPPPSVAEAWMLPAAVPPLSLIVMLLTPLSPLIVSTPALSRNVTVSRARSSRASMLGENFRALRVERKRDMGLPPQGSLNRLVRKLTPKSPWPGGVQELPFRAAPPPHRALAFRGLNCARAGSH